MSTDSPILHSITHDRFLADVQTLARSIEADDWTPDIVVGVGRGGLVPAVYLSHRLDRPMLSIDYSSASADAALADVAARSAAGTRLLIVDDINDSGGTIAALRRRLADRGGDARYLRFAVLLDNRRSGQSVDYWVDRIDRDTDKRWFVFPWEALATQQAIVDEALSVPDRLA
ncbi:phosphoribosyltransferase [Sphingobium sp. Leaf26]|uniref:phosphoribosyltransferase n=1 Tax=Sphingobium sp. Leaf26 TaxID=1735693 RepID=UPI0006F3091B|nr:phosphoribosyltransferase family protein [Sphingobium sp. Leaf26]KQM97913.1 phosphoribosyltransferase [Sphingobium sp. Leaf26]